MLFILLFGTMLMVGIVENIKGVSYPLIREEFNASWDQMGLLVSMLTIAYTGFSVIASMYLGRFGVKPSFLLGFFGLFAGLIAVFCMPGFFLAAASLFVIFASYGIFEIGVNALASKLFVKRAALLMNLLHSFYGLGAVIGPITAGIVAGNMGLNWRYAYIVYLPLALALFIPAVVVRFPGNEAETQTANGKADGRAVGNEERKGFLSALRSPLVWLMSVTLGVMVAVEIASANWGAMYFQDMHNLDPNTEGAAFVARFFVIFTISRLVSGLFIERIGYLRSLLGASMISLVILITGFLLGSQGIFVLPALGFFAAIFWPTLLAIAFVHFGRDAPVFSGAIIAISGIFSAGIQFLVGLTNQVLGSAWGYRSTVVYAAILIILLIILYRKFPKK